MARSSTKYGDLLEFLNCGYDFTEDDIREFQKLADDYSEKWASLTGRDEQTNYEHFIRSSHVSHLFFLYGNLYKYSQQGFEAIMSKVKSFYQCCTSKGGHGAAVQSHILQICHFLIQMMLWNSGHGDCYFKKNTSAMMNRILQKLISS